MDYIIQEVMVGQIVVKFTDGTRAVVGISTTDTPERIDHLVSFFDPEFIPPAETTVNPFISVGEERCACPMDMEPTEPETEVEEELAPAAPVQISSPIGESMLFYYAQKFAAAGDTRASERLDEVMSLYYGELPIDILLSMLDQKAESIAASRASASEEAAEAEDIFNQALEELENG